MDKKTKNYLIIVIVGVCLYAALSNVSGVTAFLGKIVDVLLPVIAGAILALFITVPMNGLEKRLRKLYRSKGKEITTSKLHLISFAVTAVCFSLVLMLVLTLLIPELVTSGEALYVQIRESAPEWSEKLNDLADKYPVLQNIVDEIQIDSIMTSLSNKMGTLVSNMSNAVSSTLSAVTNTLFAVIIAIYIALGKDDIKRHIRILTEAYMKPSHREKLYHWCGVFGDTFANFLSGQCVEAVILGVLMFLAFTVCSLPYAGLVGSLTAVCAIIPYLGAFISCAVAVFLTLLNSPALVLKCVIVYLVVQFVESQFIYPRVVGGSVGLSAFYTLIAALIGGNLFGIVGIIFFIPIAAAAVQLVKEDTGKRINAGKISGMEQS